MKKTGLRYVAVALILILAMISSAGCSVITGTSNPPVTEKPASTRPPVPIQSNWSPTPVTGQTLILPSIANVVAKVKPSVVAINIEVVTVDIFNTQSLQKGAGSGWIIDKSGIIVTNNHVIEGAESITVTLDDGRTFPVDAKAVATDTLADLAVLKITAENLTAISVGDSSALRIGDWVVTIGNSLGMGISATKGIVSSQGVSLEVSAGQTLNDLIQTDAAINPGNSGGPLVNMAGEVVGITSAKISTVGVEGMGYAISTKGAMPIIQQLIKTGYVVRPWLGVGLYTVNQFVIFRYNLAVENGAFVTYVEPTSPADKAGIKSGDVIIRFGDKDIADVNELLIAIHSAQVGQQVEITFWQSNTRSTVQANATLIQSPRPLP